MHGRDQKGDHDEPGTAAGTVWIWAAPIPAAALLSAATRTADRLRAATSGGHREGTVQSRQALARGYPVVWGVDPFPHFALVTPLMETLRATAQARGPMSLLFRRLRRRAEEKKVRQAYSFLGLRLPRHEWFGRTQKNNPSRGYVVFQSLRPGARRAKQSSEGANLQGLVRIATIRSRV